ncbi:MAG: hypothetical protein GX575_33315 [Candidatus Anammoximicrobium sp.]|nr:hypothetical protein [Candidatus Anammoximicrobium sp.]
MNTNETELTATADEQVRMMRNLRQTAAAWLVGFKSARSLRDAPDIPRTPGGGYDAAELVGWARRRQPRPEFSDDDIERTLQVIDWTITDSARCLLDYLTDLQRRFGDGGLLRYVDEMMAALRRCAHVEPEISTTPPGPMTRLEENRLLETENRRRLEMWHRQRLAVRVVCERCGRVRHGRKWAKAELSDGTPAVNGTCPDCESKANGRRAG